MVVLETKDILKEVAKLIKQFPDAKIQDAQDRGAYWRYLVDPDILKKYSSLT